jgi:hypothetical protein
VVYAVARYTIRRQSWAIAGGFLVAFCCLGWAAVRFGSIFQGMGMEHSLPVINWFAVTYGPTAFPLFGILAGGNAGFGFLFLFIAFHAHNFGLSRRASAWWFGETVSANTNISWQQRMMPQLENLAAKMLKNRDFAYLNRWAATGMRLVVSLAPRNRIL